jgi:hypothetical protein
MGGETRGWHGVGGSATVHFFLSDMQIFSAGPASLKIFDSACFLLRYLNALGRCQAKVQARWLNLRLHIAWETWWASVAAAKEEQEQRLFSCDCNSDNHPSCNRLLEYLILINVSLPGKGAKRSLQSRLLPWGWRDEIWSCCFSTRARRGIRMRRCNRSSRLHGSNFGKLARRRGSMSYAAPRRLRSYRISKPSGSGRVICFWGGGRWREGRQKRKRQRQSS